MLQITKMNKRNIFIRYNIMIFLLLFFIFLFIGDQKNSNNISVAIFIKYFISPRSFIFYRFDTLYPKQQHITTKKNRSSENFFVGKKSEYPIILFELKTLWANTTGFINDKIFVFAAHTVLFLRFFPLTLIVPVLLLVMTIFYAIAMSVLVFTMRLKSKSKIEKKDSALISSSYTSY